ncbi:MAG: DUF4432 family protein [Arachnia sp.]
MTMLLSSADLEVIVAPERGADILQVTDRRTGTGVLAQSPTGLSRPSLGTSDSMTAWLRGYPGGWQFLVPNAGPERVHDGVSQGYHGEAALTQWSVLTQSPAACTLQTYLASAPLRLHRHISVVGPHLVVTDTLENTSPDPVSTRMVQHPAFGEQFLNEDSYVIVGAKTLITDAQAPGTMARAGRVGTPAEILGTGPVPGSIAVPGPGSGSSLFAAFADLESAPSAILASPRHGFAMKLEWTATSFPYAWFWIEANATSGWPWFRRLYAVAVEPANILPGEGPAGGYQRGGDGISIAAEAKFTTTTRLSRQDLPGAR